MNTTTSHDASVTDRSGPARPRRSLRRRLIRVGLFLVYLLILLELGSRAYWTIKDRDEGLHLPFFALKDDWYGTFYEEIVTSGIREARVGPGDGYYDILLLGGSVLDRVHHSLAEKTQQFQQDFGKAVGQPVRVWNLSSPGMTTRDSAIKYRILSEWGKRFDLAVVYHGINDVRMNNCPPEVFKDDYTHGAFYEQFRRMERSWWLPVFTLPYTVEYTLVHLLDSKTLDFGIFVPRHRLKPEWEQYGVDVKTERTFRANLADIIARAQADETPLLLSRFAWYIPPDYSLEKLRAGQLDYAESPAPSAVELWGSVEAVRKALEVHNRVIAETASAQPGVLYLDAEARLPDEGRFFNDVCHLSEIGKQALLKAFVHAAVSGK